MSDRTADSDMSGQTYGAAIIDATQSPTRTASSSTINPVTHHGPDDSCPTSPRLVPRKTKAQNANGTTAGQEKNDPANIKRISAKGGRRFCLRTSPNTTQPQANRPGT